MCIISEGTKNCKKKKKKQVQKKEAHRRLFYWDSEHGPSTAMDFSRHSVPFTRGPIHVTQLNTFIYYILDGNFSHSLTLKYFNTHMHNKDLVF